MTQTTDDPAVIVNNQERTENRIVQVPVTDPEGEAYREAHRRAIQTTPKLAQYIDQIESVKDQIMHGRKVQQSLAAQAN